MGICPRSTTCFGRLRSDVSSDDTVVFLGDYIDRGSDAKSCIDAILASGTRAEESVS
jgi:hypothetical protein